MKLIPSVMSKVSELQALYAKLEVNATQRVRNPLPLHQMVLRVLSEVNDNIYEKIEFESTKKERCVAYGKVFYRNLTGAIYMYEAFGCETVSEYYDKFVLSKAKTVNDVMQALRSMNVQLPDNEKSTYSAYIAVGLALLKAFRDNPTLVKRVGIVKTPGAKKSYAYYIVKNSSSVSN